MLRRLRGTTIETNIETGGATDGRVFSLIDTYKILSEHKRVEAGYDAETKKTVRREVSRVLRFSVTISEWLFSGLMNYEVLTLDRGYFRLSKSIERRLYEIARKHCGDQPLWKSISTCWGAKIGTTQKRFQLRDELRQAIAADRLPEYHIALDPNRALTTWCSTHATRRSSPVS